MKGSVILGIVLLPSVAAAESDCRVVEYPDHYEATCTGEAAQARGSPPSAARARTQQDEDGVLRQEPQPEPPQSEASVLALETQPEERGAIARSSTARRHARLWLWRQSRR